MSSLIKQVEIDELSCPICQESYDDSERNPRILDCGHTFCSLCIKSLLEEDRPLCPECRFGIMELHIASYPVCYVVKKIADSVKAINKGIVANFQKTKDFVGNDEICYDGEFPSVGSCSDHKAPKHFWCTFCKLWICGTCAFLCHQKNLCKAVLANDPLAINILIENEKKKVAEQKENLIQVSQFLENFNKLNEECIINSNSVRNDILNSILGYVQSELSENYDSIEILEDALCEIDTIAKAKSLNDWRNVTKYIQNLWCCQEYPKETKDILKDFWKHAIRQGHIASWVRYLQKRCVFIASVNGEKYATFSTVISNVYLVHSLRKFTENLLQSSSIIFHLSDLFLEGMFTYIQLSENNKYIGTIIFKMMSTQRSEHFRMLCTGEKGPCYKGTKFFNSGGNYNRFLAGGDYEYNNGTGGRCLFPFNDNNDVFMRAGLVCGSHSDAMFQLGQFKIFYDCVGNYQSIARGIMADVVQGLELIQEIAKSGRYMNAVVADCGIAYFLTT